jgi:polyvinyl alcohol dehydrogenase (cytochrome)
LWSFATTREYNTVNGIYAHGGAIDAAGAVAVDDMLYVQSGYSMFGQLPGNALLAFRVSADDKPHQAKVPR